MIELVSLPKHRPLDMIALSDEEPDAVIRPHRHEYFEIVWSLGKTGYHSIDFVEYPLQPARLYMITPGQVHDSSHLGNQVQLITFHPGFIQSHLHQFVIEAVFFPKSGGVPFLDLDEEGKRELGALFAIMRRESTRHQPDWLLLESLLSSFLRYLVRYSRERSSNENLDERVLALLPLINHNFRLQHKTDFYAGQLALTGKRLNELIRAQLGKTVTVLIHERILLEAQRDLAYTAKTIKTIAMELGFEDPAYFCRFFRRLTGDSPVGFRKRVNDNA